MAGATLGGAWLSGIVALSLALSLWGNGWGAPDIWQPDEITRRAARMASEHDVDPHHFAYGNLHHYLLIIGAIAPVKAFEAVFDRPPSHQDAARPAWVARHDVRVIRMARAISAVLTGLTVAVTCAMGSMLFGDAAGALAGLLVAVSMYTVLVAHYATVDAAANAWYWLACFGALLVWRRGDSRWYVLAAVSAGLAIGTKVDRVVIVLPLVAAHLLRGQGLQPRRLAASAGLVCLSALLANPVLFLSPFEFLDGFTRDIFFNAMRPSAGGNALLQFPTHLMRGLGLPMFSLSMAALFWALWSAARGTNRSTILWLALTILPYPILIGTKLVRYTYVTAVIPGLMLLAALAYAEAERRCRARLALPLRVSVGAVVAAGLLYTVALDLEFTHDSRDAASAWIARYIPAGASIDESLRGPRIPLATYRVGIVNFEHEAGPVLGVARDRLMNSARYNAMRARLRATELWAGRALGTPVRESEYRAWFDWAATKQPRTSTATYGDPADYLVLSCKEVAPYRRKLEVLATPGSGYRLVARFHYMTPPGLPQVDVTQVNPWVYIFERVTPAEPSLHKHAIVLGG